MTHSTALPQRRLPMAKRLLLSATALVAAGAVMAQPANANSVRYNANGTYNDNIAAAFNDNGLVSAAPGVVATFAGAVNYSDDGIVQIGTAVGPDNGTIIFSPTSIIGSANNNNLAVWGGTVRLGGDAVRTFLRGSNTSLVVGSTGTLDLFGTNQAVHRIQDSITTGGRIINDGAAAATFEVLGGGGVFRGTIADGASALRFRVSGGGGLTLGGANTYTGGTEVVNSTVLLSNSSAFGTGDVSLTGSTVRLADGISIANNIQLGSSAIAVFEVDAARAASLSGNISGATDFFKTGGGALELRGEAQDIARYFVNAGTLTANGDTDNAIADAASVILNPAATFRVLNDETIADLVGQGRVSLEGEGTHLAVGRDQFDTTFSGTIVGDGALRKIGNNTLTLRGNNTYSGGTVLSQGTLVIASSGALGTDGLATARDTQLVLRDGVHLENDVRIDDFGFDIQVADDHSAVLASDISELNNNSDLGFRKTGGGALVLTGLNSETAFAEVHGGTLQVDGRIAAPVTVWADATLTGRGTVQGDVRIEDGGVLAGRTGDRLTVSGNMTLNDNSYVDVSLGAPSNAALFDVGGNLTLDGQLNIADAGGFGQGVYRLFDYDGALTDNGLDIVRSPDGIPREDISVQTVVGNQINIVVAGDEPGPGEVPDIQFWDGGNTAPDGRIAGGSGTWDALSTNWTRANGQANDAWGGRFAVFQGEEGLVTVDGGAAPIAITGMQFASSGYAVTGGSLALSAPDTVIRVGDGTQSGTQMTATISSNLTGSGRLVKDDLGTLVLDGANSYAGDTVVRNGWLIGDTDSIRNNLINNAGVTFDQNDDGTFAGTIEGTGRSIKDGNGTLKLAGLSTTDWGVARGVLVSQAGQLRGDAEIDNQGTLRFHQAASAAYQGVLSGTGKFDVAAQNNAQVVLTADSSAFAGTTSVSSGELAVNGKLGGQTTVRSGGRLSGTGTLGSVNIQAGATHGPGNSIGSQAILGDYINRGTLQAEVSPSAADRLVVGGTVDIGGATLDLLMSSAPIAEWNSNPFTLIQNDGKGAIAGQFAGVVNPFTFLSHSLNYAGGDGNDLTLQLSRNAVKFADAGKTRNQIAIGKALDGMPVDSQLVGHVALLNQPDARAAFDQLSGEVHASAKTALVDDSARIRNAVNDRIRAAFEGVAAKAMPVMAYGPEGGEFDTANTDRSAVWGHAFGSWSEVDGDGNAAELEHSTGGVLFGGDALVAETVRLGLMAGYTQSSFSIDERVSSGSSDNAHLGVYAGAKVGRVAVRGGLAYAWHDIETTRRVAFGGLSEQIKSNYDAGTFQAFGEAGYRIDTPAAAFEPFAGLAYVSLRSDAFTETGGISTVTAKSQTTGVGFSTLGLRASTDFWLGTMGAAVRGTLGWRHAFGDVTPQSVQAFAASQPFTIAGVPIGKDSAIVEAALDLDLSARATLGFAYHGQLSGNAQDHGIKAQLGVKF